MSSPDQTLQILIDVRSRLDEVVKAQAEFRKMRQEVTSTHQALKTGFGVDLARRGLDLLTGTVKQFVFESFRMADSIKDGARNLEISNQAYQVLGNLLRDAGGDASLLTQAISNNNRSLVEARTLGNAAAGAYRTLGLDIAQLERIPAERRFELIGRAVLNATDKTKAYNAASKVLVARNLPTLLGALKDLAENGWDKVSDSQERAGRIMSDDTIARLESAKKDLEKAMQKGTIFFGENIGGAMMSWEALKAGLSNDLPGFFKMLGEQSYSNFLAPWRNFTGESPFVKWLAKNVPAAPTYAGLPPPGGTDAANEIALKNALAQAEYNLAAAMLKRQTIENDPNVTGLSIQARALDQMQQELVLRQKLIAATAATPLDATETQLARDLKLRKLEEQNQQLRDQIRKLTGSNQFNDAAQESRDKFSAFRTDSVDNKQGLGDSLQTGAMDWVTGLGSKGQQVAGALQSSLGATVSGISDGIYGWITGAQSFGSAIINLGSTALQTFLQTIIQIGVQWAITAAISKLFRKEEEKDTKKATTQKAAEAGMKSIAQLGPIWGVVAFAASLAIIMALASKFATGGLVSGPGTGTSDSIPARLSNGEYILTAETTKRLGPGFLNSVNAGGPLPVAGVPVAFGGNGGGGAGSANRPISIHNWTDRTEMMRWIHRHPESEHHVVDTMQRRKGDMFNA